MDSPRLAAIACPTISLTTHILDLALGRPAVGVAIRLERHDPPGWSLVSTGLTGSDGRITTWSAPVGSGTYRLVVDSGAYFEATSRPTFYPEINIQIRLESLAHYHVPILLSPYSYSTYLGS
ncbi:hydroxyisourate hydrolase [Micromonospora sp. ANENR4]|uniref:hydroxyisourate hydrolase n=1 Tax=unclassified Micromonospora TaxID=2617518 RepID=UPI00188EE777|nr:MULTISPECIES: hydroxyisourate hydrolase [unclassified Micromonospora]MBF5033680.1 hydroxyisourate hydrolase [Micromonospora sp. ANENR4]MCZ7476242.1 hydroxyisourate hydrolase [Micromonospora sp. WMMC273]